MGKQRKIGIYSGSFNPIHIGHLALANWLAEYTDLEEIWFVVSRSHRRLPALPSLRRRTPPPAPVLHHRHAGSPLCPPRRLRVPPHHRFRQLGTLRRLEKGGRNPDELPPRHLPAPRIPDAGSRADLDHPPHPSAGPRNLLVLHPHRDCRGERHPFLPPRKHLEIRGANGNVDAGIIPSFTCLAQQFIAGTRRPNKIKARRV